MRWPVGHAGRPIGRTQSGVYFSLTAWLPTLWQNHGLSTDTTGHLLLILGASGIIGGLPMPLLATRRSSQRPLVAATVLALGAGLLGLLISPATGALMWAVALGLGQGAALSLALTLFALRSRTAEGAAQLSAMAQSAGYLIAGGAPLLIGTIRDLSGGWTVPLLALLALLVPLTASGWAIAQPRYLQDEVKETT